MGRLESLKGAALIEAAVGFAKKKFPHTEFAVLYEKFMRLLPLMPEDYIYRTTLEKSLKEKNDAITKYADVTELEQQIGQGTIEQVLRQLYQEMTLVQNMVQTKPWEPLMEKPPPHQWTWPPYK